MCELIPFKIFHTIISACVYKSLSCEKDVKFVRKNAATIIWVWIPRYTYTMCIYGPFDTYVRMSHALIIIPLPYSFPFLTHLLCPCDFEQRDYRLIYDNIFSQLSIYLVDCKTFPIL